MEAQRLSAADERSRKAAELPSGWEVKMTPDGKPFYIDHNTASTHWQPPAAVTAARVDPPAPSLSRVLSTGSLFSDDGRSPLGPEDLDDAALVDDAMELDAGDAMAGDEVFGDLCVTHAVACPQLS